MEYKYNETSCCSQDKIWDYFQNSAIESFAAAKPRLDVIIKQISRKVTSTTPCVLNIGVGNGYFEEAIQRRGWEIYSLDPNEKALNRLIEKNIKCRVGYITQIPFDDAIFDFVVVSEVLEHLTDEQFHRGIREIDRVLKRGGWLIGTVPYCEDLFSNQVICPRCGEVFHRWGHQKSFDIKTIHDELSPFFEVLEVRRTAFVAFRERSFMGKLKGLIQLIMAQYGAAVAGPSIYFSVRKK